MGPPRITRRSLGISLAAIPAIVSLSKASFAESAGNNGVSHGSEAIHQDVAIGAARPQVYRALTDAGQFDRVTRLSDAIALVTAPGAKKTAISRAVGGPFVLFGGYITGLNIEIVPDQRLVQVWRAASWNPGDFSIVRFVLKDEDSGTKIIFDHRGFPQGTADHLAQGWYSHYWEPLGKLLA